MNQNKSEFGKKFEEAIAVKSLDEINGAYEKRFNLKI
jgi:hypothetical protein